MSKARTLGNFVSTGNPLSDGTIAASELTGTLPVANGGTGVTTSTGTGNVVLSASPTLTGDVTLNAQGDLRFADADSSNWVAFQAPATVAANVTWTLPAADGTSAQVLQTNGSGVLSFAAAGGGKVLQVVQGTRSGNSYTTSNVFNTSNLFATITPSSTSSRIMMIATSSNLYDQTGGLQVALFRGTGGNGSGSNIATLGTSSSISGFLIGATLNWIDSPASTSALTYTIMQLSRNGSSLVSFIGEQSGTASMLLLEIGA